jgi:hypothetical protein
VGQPGERVVSDAALEEMRQYLLTMYEGVSVNHSFAIGDQVFDCVPIDQQPSVRLRALTEIHKPPPPLPEWLGSTEPGDEGRDNATSRGSSDECEVGTIPMERITLSKLAHFGVLQQFFQKSASRIGPAYYAHDTARSSKGHYYGGYSLVNLWSPDVITDAPYYEIHSLAQQWYFGGEGTDLQTAEVGWIVQPATFDTSKAVRFIYWTADGYTTTGCYNLDCVGFVQVDKRVKLGHPFPHYSMIGGKQYEVGLGYHLHNGDWWLAVGKHWVGYYPGSIYQGGQLSRFATFIEFGGETVGCRQEVVPGECISGSFYWPPMGSGEFAENGYKRAAYHRRIDYLDSKGILHAPDLKPKPQLPCYTVTTPRENVGWGTYFFFGGPGGKKSDAAASCSPSTDRLNE